jgi:hypothetical protein
VKDATGQPRSRSFPRVSNRVLFNITVATFSRVPSPGGAGGGQRKVRTIQRPRNPQGFLPATDSGIGWTPVDTTSFINISVFALVPSGTNLFACAPEGVFLSTDYSSHWKEVNSSRYDKTGLAVDGTNLFVTTSSHGVWRRPLSEMITSAESPISQTPTSFELHQNYPNPFNPSTAIKFELPKASQVTLGVYELLGREVSMLLNERRDAGIYEVKCAGLNLASGVYFYRLQAGDFTQTKRLLLLR